MNNAHKTNAKKERPKYNLWQMSAYMMRMAWKEQKSVLLLSAVLVFVALATNLLELFIVPVILQKIELAVPLGELLTSIALFSVGLMLLASLKEYVSSNTLFGRILIRSQVILGSINNKTYTTSFPNTEDPKLLKTLEKAYHTTNNNTDAAEAIWGTLTEVTQSVAGFIIYLALLSSLDPVLIAVVLATTVTGYFLSKRINEWGFRHRDEEAGLVKKMRYVYTKAEDITLAKDIRIFGMRPWLEGVFSSTLRAYDAFILRREKVYIWANVLDVVLSLLRNGIAYYYLITLTLSGGLPASQFLLLFAAVGGFTTWVTTLLTSFSTLHMQSLDLNVVREYTETPEPFKFSQGKPLPEDAHRACQIELRNVSFRYPGTQTDTLHNLSLTIKAGEKLAIVGLNGAGKTTLVKLICGFYDPTAGSVLLNGEDIRQYNRHDYYKQFSAVFQQFSVLEATLAQNVSQSVEDADINKIKDCIEKAGLTDKVAALPQLEQTHIGRKVFEDGIELSGGEMQRLMLARALYKDAPIIVLDEPTAALDPIAENDIYLKYNEMTAGRTSVYISHRLASTRFCDRIIYLADGNIAQEGTHSGLMKQGGAYADLFSVQSKYYQEGRDFDGEQKN